MIFCDNKNNIQNDLEKFNNDNSRQVKAKINIISKDSFKLTLINGNNKEIFIKELSTKNFKAGERINVLVKSNALYWDQDPKDNFHVKFEKDSSYVYFIENCSNIFDINFCPTIQIYKTKSTNELIIKMNMLTYYDNNTNVISTDKALFEVVKEYDPEYEQESIVRTDKKRIWTLTEPRDSLPYIEVQVDLLCKIIFTILDNNAELKEQVLKIIPNLNDFEIALNDTYVSNIKSPSDCLKEITIHKNRIREIQKDYYNQIGKSIYHEY